MNYRGSAILARTTLLETRRYLQVRFRGSGPFQLAAEPTNSHNSNCDGMFNLCSNNGVSCRVIREVKAQNC
eukprot:1149871-Pelagomonas_calceolata.AAC.1